MKLIYSPFQKSLLLEVNLDWQKRLQTTKPTASDDMINLYSLADGLAIATWKVFNYFSISSMEAAPLNLKI